MLRKINLATLISLSLTTSCYATGWYVGAGAGPEAGDFNQTAKIIVRHGSAVVENIKDSTHLAGTGIFGTFFGGYEWMRQMCYWAGEVNGDVSSLGFKSLNSEFVHGTFSHTTYRIQNSFGLSVLPGYLLTPATLFYGRLGYANGSFKITTTDSSLANINSNLSGFRWGFGMKQSLSHHWGVRLEYSQILYQQTKFRVVSGAATKTTKINPTIGKVEAGLVYEFC